MNVATLKQTLRSGKYAWPGGYPLYFLAKDGEALSFEAVKENLKQVMHAMTYPAYRNDQWTVVGADINWEDPTLTCAHTGKLIESAYAEAEA